MENLKGPTLEEYRKETIKRLKKELAAKDEVIAKQKELVDNVHSINRIAALRIAEMLSVIDIAIDFIEQNEMQGQRMEVAEYDDLRDAVKPFMQKTKE